MVTNGYDGRGLVRIAPNILFDTRGRIIYLMKDVLVPEDILATRFSKVLDDHGLDYAVVAGYVAILFGRARRSDDVDFLIMPLTEKEFVDICKEAADEGFNLIQGDIQSEKSIRRVFRDYLSQGYGVRLMYDDQILPNIELKVATTTTQKYAIANAYKVIINNMYSTRVSPLELQIAYKLYLGSDKDVSDAVFLYTLFEKVLDHGELSRWCSAFSVNCRILEAGD